MANPVALRSGRAGDISDAEWDVRVVLAGCYRAVDIIGWSELIFNHITARVPGPERHFLINPYGLWYDEVMASNLVKVDLAGNIVGASEWGINPAGYVIHSAVHEAVEDAHCVIHIHTTAGMAISCLDEGLRTETIYDAVIDGEVAYHDFEGVPLYEEEKPRLVASLGDKRMMILRNHGLLTVGRSIPEAFMYMGRLNRACEIPMAAHGTGGSVRAVTDAAITASKGAYDGLRNGDRHAEKVFAAMLRRVEKADPSYKD